MTPSGQSSSELALRIADAHALLLSVPIDEDGAPVPDDYASLFSALDYALRGDGGCVEPDEWEEARRAALENHRKYLGL